MTLDRERLAQVDRQLAAFGKADSVLETVCARAREMVAELGDVDAALAALGGDADFAPPTDKHPALDASSDIAGLTVDELFADAEPAASGELEGLFDDQPLSLTDSEAGLDLSADFEAEDTSEAEPDGALASSLEPSSPDLSEALELANEDQAPEDPQDEAAAEAAFAALLTEGALSRPKPELRDDGAAATPPEPAASEDAADEDAADEDAADEDAADEDAASEDPVSPAEQASIDVELEAFEIDIDEATVEEPAAAAAKPARPRTMPPPVPKAASIAPPASLPPPPGSIPPPGSLPPPVFASFADDDDEATQLLDGNDFLEEAPPSDEFELLVDEDILELEDDAEPAQDDKPADPGLISGIFGGSKS